MGLEVREAVEVKIRSKAVAVRRAAEAIEVIVSIDVRVIIVPQGLAMPGFIKKNDIFKLQSSKEKMRLK